MTEIHILSPEEWEKPEIKKLKEVISKVKPIIDKDARHRAYISLSEISKLFPSRRSGDRYDESVINNLRKYINYFNKKYCQDGCIYKSGIAWSKNGEKVIFIEEFDKQENVNVETLSTADIADIENNREDDRVRIGNTKIDINELPDKMKEKLSEELDKDKEEDQEK